MQLATDSPTLIAFVKKMSKKHTPLSQMEHTKLLELRAWRIALITSAQICESVVL